MNDINGKHNELKHLIVLNLKPQNNYELTEKDFYPPEDTRVYRSMVEDIVDGDNFADYAKSFYEDYEDEIFDV